MRKLSDKRKHYLNKRSLRGTALKAKENRKQRKSRLRKLLNKIDRTIIPRSALLKMLGKGYKGFIGSTQNINCSVHDDFSLITNPKKTLRAILKIAAAGAKRENRGFLRVDQTDLVKFDLAAIALLDMVILEMRDEALSGAASGLGFQGIVPSDRETARFIRAIGTPRHLGVKEQELSKAEKKKVEVFDKRVRVYKKSLSPVDVEPREKIADGFVEHVGRCLATTKGLVINTKGVALLSAILCEIINNAEEHAGMTDWSLLGYLDVSKDVPVLEIAMINFGKSMAQTFLDLERNGYTWRQIQPYIDSHTGAGLFKPGWSEQDLLTVIALQPNVSSKNGPEDTTRGAGTTQLLEFFQFVDKYCHGDEMTGQMAILSGGTHIYIDGTHQLQRVGSRPVIAFNDANDLSQKPDGRYVRNLSGIDFPGTIISIKLPLPGGVTTTG